MPEIFEPILVDFSSSQLLFETEAFSFFRAIMYKALPNTKPIMRDESSASRVLIKTPSEELFDRLDEVDRIIPYFQNEKRMAERFASKCGMFHVPRWIRRTQEGIALVYDDFGGCSLREMCLKMGFSDRLRVFLKVAIDITRMLYVLHDSGGVFRNLSMKCFLVDDNFDMRVFNYTLMSFVESESVSFDFIDRWESSMIDLQYVSPEQTGRMNRCVDYRSDFYSLGVILYEWLCGTAPFDGADRHDLVYAHLAVQPRHPSEVWNEIPKAYGDVVMKLMSKRAEDRYFSCSGLLVDLESLTRGVDKSFIAGVYDDKSRLMIPEKLYGREEQVKAIIEAYETVCSGQVAVVMISGYSGIGKTSLVPFNGLIKHLLSLSTELFEKWRDKILEALEGHGGALVEIIPGLIDIIGEQEELPKLGPEETTKRMSLALKKFVRVFCSVEHPLVLFMDDITWADAESLKLMEELANLHGIALMLIGAYRDNEVPVTSLLNEVLGRLRHTDHYLFEIVLEKLNVNDVQLFLSDCLYYHMASPRLCKLTQLLYSKSGGNPFFLIQLLKHLVSQGTIYFNFEIGEWEWTVEDLEKVEITENVVYLMIKLIRGMKESNQRILKCASCCGTIFKSRDVAKCLGMSSYELVGELDEALKNNLVVKVNGCEDIEATAVEINTDKFDNFKYAFTHDRIQQASNEMLKEEEKRNIHLKLARYYYEECLNEKMKEEALFGIVQHYNEALDLVVEDEERLIVCELNLRASKRARASASYSTSLTFSNAAIRSFPDKLKKDHFEFYFKLLLNNLESEYLNTNYERAKEMIDLALQESQSELQKAQVLSHQVLYKTSQGKVLEAIESGWQAFRLLGVEIPTESGAIDRMFNELFEKNRMLSKDIEKLIELPEMTREDYRVVIKIELTKVNNPLLFEKGIDLIPPVYFARPELLVPMILKLVELSVKNGISSLTSYVYCLFGLVLSGLKYYKDSYVFGKAAMHVLDKYPNDPIECQVIKVYASHIQCWNEPLMNTLETFNRSLQAGINYANKEYYGYGSAERIIYSFFSGVKLELIMEQGSRLLTIVEELKQDIGIYYTRLFLQLIYNLINSESVIDPIILTGQYFNESDFHKLESVTLLVFAFYLCKLILCVVFGEYDKACIYSALAKQNAKGAPGLFMLAELEFYATCGFIMEYRNNKEFLIDDIENGLNELKVGMNSCEYNLDNKIKILEACKAAIIGDSNNSFKHATHSNFNHEIDQHEAERVEHLFDLAIDASLKDGFIHEYAICLELKAKLLMRSKSNYYLLHQEAYYAYLKWGSTTKGHQLLNLIGKRLLSTTPRLNSSTVSEKIERRSIVEINSSILIKACEVINDLVDFDSICRTLMELVVKCVDADRGYLVMQDLINNVDPHVKLSIVGKNSKGENGKGEKSSSSSVSDGSSSSNIQMHPSTCTSSTSTSTTSMVPWSLINYCLRSKKKVINEFDDFIKDEYFNLNKTNHVLCVPLVDKARCIGCVYLESNRIGFKQEQIETLKLLLFQTTTHLVNSMLISGNEKKDLMIEKLKQDLRKNNTNLESLVQNRTKILEIRNKQLTDEIQERKRIEVELKRAKDEAEAATLSKSQFLANMSHEIRTPMNAIIGFTDLLLLTNLNSNQAEFASSVKSSAQDLLTIINDILDFSKVETGNIVLESLKFNIEKSIESCLEVVNSIKNSENLDLSLIVNKNLPNFVIGDPTRFRQVVLNLLSNAIKFTKQGDVCIQVEICENEECEDELAIGNLYEVELTLGNQLTDAQSCFALNSPLPSVKSNNSHSSQPSIYSKQFHSTSESFHSSNPTNNKYLLVVKVYDTGIGISKENRKKLFKLFQQADSSITRNFGGTGLGLSLSKSLANAMGGDVYIASSKVNVGSCFVFKCKVGIDFSSSTSLISDSTSKSTSTSSTMNILNNMTLNTSTPTMNIPSTSTMNTPSTPSTMSTPSTFTFTSSTTSTSTSNESNDNDVLNFNLLLNKKYSLIVDDKSSFFSKSLIYYLENTFNCIPNDKTPDFIIIKDSFLLPTNIPSTVPSILIKSKKSLHKSAFELTQPVKRKALYETIIKALKINPKNNLQSIPESIPEKSQSKEKTISDVSILLAEDNLVNQRLIFHMLKKIGYKCDLAENGVQVLELLEKKTYNIILMDVQMPVMDGITCTRIILKKNLKNRPLIVALTANALSESKERCLDAGMDDFLTKPIKLSELENVLSKIQSTRK
ncbi:Signal transduction response regulator, receiver domain-containing protein [Rozella allomycis CSF55]|uniref:histidine kinase n=1 Tax=Rozella allomycis (strain CSF55) TaxID=988480 RepID=A0A075APD8_ROZAC|nr:Signal transduction response regulator, receiver domain-containing protein [Rozella allomycis CSF55]|eukprot:EPZ31888.1 Signal transduction response regulator, receiver domain-containing protein [Rozella allomycis CSF55]